MMFLNMSYQINFRIRRKLRSCLYLCFLCTSRYNIFWMVNWVAMGMYLLFVKISVKCV
jgi:hypothetical protein